MDAEDKYLKFLRQELGAGFFNLQHYDEPLKYYSNELPFDDLPAKYEFAVLGVAHSPNSRMGRKFCHKADFRGRAGDEVPLLFERHWYHHWSQDYPAERIIGQAKYAGRLSGQGHVWRMRLNPRVFHAWELLEVPSNNWSVSSGGSHYEYDDSGQVKSFDVVELTIFRDATSADNSSCRVVPSSAATSAARQSLSDSMSRVDEKLRALEALVIGQKIDDKAHELIEGQKASSCSPFVCEPGDIECEQRVALMFDAESVEDYYAKRAAGVEPSAYGLKMAAIMQQRTLTAANEAHTRGMSFKIKRIPGSVWS